MLDRATMLRPNSVIKSCKTPRSRLHVHANPATGLADLSPNLLEGSKLTPVVLWASVFHRCWFGKETPLGARSSKTVRMLLRTKVKALTHLTRLQTDGQLGFPAQSGSIGVYQSREVRIIVAVSR